MLQFLHVQNDDNVKVLWWDWLEESECWGLIDKSWGSCNPSRDDGNLQQDEVVEEDIFILE